MLGDPEQIVSDIGTPFTSREFGEFCSQHGIRHIRSSPYHPATNGEAECFVQVFKRGLLANSDQTSYSTVQISASQFDTECEVHRFIQRYRTVPLSTTGRTPSELFWPYNTTNIKSYSPSGSETSIKFSTLFSSESLHNSSRSIFPRRSRSIRSTLSRPSEMGCRTSSSSIRTSVLRRQVWRSNLLATCISTSNEPTRTTSGYSPTSETQIVKTHANSKRKFKFRIKFQRVGYFNDNRTNLRVLLIRWANTRRLYHQLLSSPRHLHARRKSYRRRQEV